MDLIELRDAFVFLGADEALYAAHFYEGRWTVIELYFEPDHDVYNGGPL